MQDSESLILNQNEVINSCIHFNNYYNLNLLVIHPSDTYYNWINELSN